MEDGALAEFFLLCHRLAAVALVPERDDVLVWRWSSDGCYSSKSAYEAFFAGSMKASITNDIWRSRVSYNCKFFSWLASRNRCWTA
jgi:hypothetical protein